jgi:hypothetical protein
MKADESFRVLGRGSRELREIKCAAMIVLFHRVGDSFKRSWRMIKIESIRR